MITQQEIIDRLNQLTLRYNLTWYDIKYDADKAIAKINAYLGTKYPKMSSILISPTSTYTVGNTDADAGEVEVTVYEIFPEEHIHNVVIPFIAMEVLARDEEFTTIYNKYAHEVEDGLFTMFQKEFNRVPFVFRQNPDKGVFFPSDSAQGRIQRNRIEADLPIYKFRVYYHINKGDIVLSSDTSLRFTEDYTAYLYGTTAVIKGWDYQMLSYDGTKAYEFAGWMKNKNPATINTYTVGSEVEILSDLHLYANWIVEDTLRVDHMTGTVYIKDEFKKSLTNLIIPDYIGGTMITTIPTNFLHGTGNGLGDDYATHLEKIVLPKNLTRIEQRAFYRFNGTSIIFPDAHIDIRYGGISIEAWAFESTPNLTSIILTPNIIAIETNTFPQTEDKTMVVYCRILERNKPDGWTDGWYASPNPEQNYNIFIWWGYNG